MRRGYLLSPAAQADLGAIWDYTVETWGAAQAERYILALRAACEALAEGRKHGQAINDIRPGYRKLAVGSHLLFFRVTDSGLVDVVRILHRRVDMPRHLQE